MGWGEYVWQGRGRDGYDDGMITVMGEDGDQDINGDWNGMRSNMETM